MRRATTKKRIVDQGASPSGQSPKNGNSGANKAGGGENPKSGGETLKVKENPIQRQLSKYNESDFSLSAIASSEGPLEFRPLADNEGFDP